MSEKGLHGELHVSDKGFDGRLTEKSEEGVKGDVQGVVEGSVSVGGVSEDSLEDGLQSVHTELQSHHHHHPRRLQGIPGPILSSRPTTAPSPQVPPA